MAFVYPRFDEYPAQLMGADYITWLPRSIDPLLTQCAYERQWQQLADQRDRLRLIVLYGWNLYGEQAYIEPAIATSPRPSIGERYVTRTRAYYQALLAGRALVPASYCAYLPLVSSRQPGAGAPGALRKRPARHDAPSRDHGGST